MSSLSRDLTRAWSLSAARWRLLMEAVVWLGLLRAATVVLPYRRVASLLRLCQSGPCGRAPTSHPGDWPDGLSPQVWAVGWAVRAAAARTPWRSTCLAQSLAGYVILRRRGVPSVVCLGVAKDRADGFSAHSWLRCGDYIVTGGRGYQRYTPIASYQPAAGLTG